MILPNRIKNKGFTIIELMVSIAIMVIILAVILVNYKKFDSGIVMTNLAYDVALSIRTAQTYGISTRGAKVSGATEFDRPYGINFEINPDDPSSVNKYLLFADTNLNRSYDEVDSLTATKYNIRGSYYIKDLCWLDSSTPSAVKTCGMRSADITFLRPDPDALIYVSGEAQDALSALEIHIGSTQDASAIRVITVRPTGQISVRQTLEE